MVKTNKRWLKIAISMVLVLTMAFPAMTGIAVAETRANQLYMNIEDSNTAYESIGRLPGNVVKNIKMYYSDGDALNYIGDKIGLSLPQKAGVFTYKGSGVWEWNNTGVTPGIYEIKYTRNAVTYSMRLSVYCDPAKLNLKWNADKTEATFTRVVGVDYYVAQITVDGKELIRKGITGNKITLPKEDIAAACNKSAKSVNVEITLTPFGKDADCQAYIRGNNSSPLCQSKIEATFKVSEFVKEEVKEEPKKEVKEPAKEEPKKEVKEQPKETVKEEIKDEPKKEDVEESAKEVKEEPKEKVQEQPKEEVKETVKEEPKQEVKEEPKETSTKETVKEETKEETKVTVKASDQKLIDGIESTTIKVKTQFIMNLYGGDKIKVTWTKSPGYKVDYYQVYRSMSKTKGFKKAFTTKNGKATSYTNTGGIVKFETYYYKVRGVREINGQKYYTKWSNVKKQIFA